MLTRITKWASIVMKWASIALLFPAAVLWRPAGSFQQVLQFVVCAGAALVSLQAVRGSKYFWAAGFAAIAVLFNPVAPITLPSTTVRWLDSVSIAAFLVSLAVLRNHPVLLSAPLTTTETPRRESVANRFAFLRNPNPSPLNIVKGGRESVHSES